MRLRASRRVLRAAIVSACLIPLVTAAWWPFPPKRFTGNGLLPAGPLGLDNDERVIAFGDFNNDQYLDVLTLGSDYQTLGVRLWSHDEFVFKSAGSFRHPKPVHNVIPGDFTQDGTLDLLVVADGISSNTLSMTVYTGQIAGGFSSSTLSVPPSSTVQPFVVDANGDLKIDLLGHTSTSGNTFKIWKNVWNSSSARPDLFTVSDANFQGASCKISSSHSNAMVDLDGDCLADLFIVCDDGNSRNKHFQIWTNTKEQGFVLAQSGRLPPGIQAISFADIDRDGAVDMVFMTCDSVAQSGIGSNCVLNVVYNIQLPVCASSTSPSIINGQRVCRPLDALCMRDPSFHFDLSRSSNNTYQRVPLSSLLSSATGTLVMDTSFGPSSLPLPARTGDINLDGFADLMLIRADTGRNGLQFTPTILMNVPCGEKGASVCERGGRRAWKIVRQGADGLEMIKDARGAAFVDVDEDGTLDVLVQRTGKDGQGKLAFVQNNFYHDAFFLKAIVLNHACPSGRCVAPNGTFYQPWGVSYSGGTFKYTVIDTTGSRSAAQVAQLPQTAHHALQAPYAFLGLGRTNNYIELLFAGATSRAREHYTVLEGVVPNSRVVALPPHPVPQGAAEGTWRTELFLRPGSWIHWVGALVVIVLIMLSGVIAGLHVAEKRADEKERRMASHHINFDAL